MSKIAHAVQKLSAGFATTCGTTVLAFLLLTLTMAAVTVTVSVVDAIAVRSRP